MANAGTITASNSVYMLSVAGLYASPQQLAGYSTDAAFDTEATEFAEVQIGVDGFMSAGFVPALTRQTVALQADSPSAILFDTWAQAQKTTGEIYFGSATILLPSISRRWTLTNIVLRSWITIPGTRKVLQARTAGLTIGGIGIANI